MMRITDILYTIPDILLIILLAMAIKEPLEGLADQARLRLDAEARPQHGVHLHHLRPAVLVGMARIVRSQVLTLKESEYVTAAARWVPPAGASSRSTC